MSNVTDNPKYFIAQQIPPKLEHKQIDYGIHRFHHKQSKWCLFSDTIEHLFELSNCKSTYFTSSVLPSTHIWTATYTFKPSSEKIANL